MRSWPDFLGSFKSYHVVARVKWCGMYQVLPCCAMYQVLRVPGQNMRSYSGMTSYTHTHTEHEELFGNANPLRFLSTDATQQTRLTRELQQVGLPSLFV